MFVNHFSNPVLLLFLIFFVVLLSTLCFANQTLNGIVFAFVCLLILVLHHNTYSIKHPKNNSKNVSITYKIFPFFILKKGRKKITVSLTHKNLLQQTLVCSRAPKHELLIGIVLTSSSLFTLWPVVYLTECNVWKRYNCVRFSKHPR